ncbi:helix-turn-helix domain-containing protein [Ruminococcus champanellensis]|uniref:helix-turn-helix domain-containing protein n=2 Tax=Ruminococcus champanellensis TaxID=1161942 RepID=UPI0011C9E19E|nr:helix-turn-helix domain-containing protein [Ruminococcus champanellensis]
MLENPDPQNISTISGKLKWYRFHNGLHQQDVCKAVGIDRTTYSRYEDTVLDTYSLDKLTQIANFFQIEPTELLDDYHLFLYHGQGAQIKRLRKSLNLTQSQFANYIDVPLGTLKKWEQDRVNIQRTTYEKLSQLSSPSPHV